MPYIGIAAPGIRRGQSAFLCYQSSGDSAPPPESGGDVPISYFTLPPITRPLTTYPTSHVAGKRVT
ncbi:MAG: hypothetical protein Q4D81_05090, partial [Eubacteriales bacterium]|nr:hypothetical protein [Eubacteriales bacterium]